MTARGNDRQRRYEEMLSQIREEDDCFGDYSSYLECDNILKHYDRKKALVILKKLLHKYRLQMDELAFLCGGRYLRADENYELAEDGRIVSDLQNIGSSIPVYALLREGRTGEAEQLLADMVAIAGREEKRYGYSVV